MNPSRVLVDVLGCSVGTWWGRPAEAALQVGIRKSAGGHGNLQMPRPSQLRQEGEINVLATRTEEAVFVIPPASQSYFLIFLLLSLSISPSLRLFLRISPEARLSQTRGCLPC